jgi:phosphate transport system protein
MTRHFERELDSLRHDLAAMGMLVNEQLERACAALFGANRELADAVILGDTQVDEFDTEIDRRCQNILALTQPVAVDLRLLMSALRINGQFERIGDIAVNIAERVAPLAGHTDLLSWTRLGEMTQIARIMVKDSLTAFMNNDPAVADRIMESDDVVDDLNRIIFDEAILAMKQHPSLVEPAAHILILSRQIERLADHATNIAEDVIFLVQARQVKHNGALPKR